MSATVARERYPAGESGRLELIEGRHHRRLVEPDELGELLLGVPSPGGGTEHRMAARSDPEGLERCRHLPRQGEVRLGEQPLEVAGQTLRAFLSWSRRTIGCGGES